MRYLRRLLLVTVLGLGIGCDDSKPASSCPKFEGEFAEEQQQLCLEEELRSQINDDPENETELGEICDLVDGVHEAIASAFLYHGWVPGAAQSPLYNPEDPFYTTSPLFIPNNSTLRDVLMQCARSIVYNKDKGYQDYGCAVSAQMNPSVDTVWFDVLTQAGYPIKMNAGYVINENAKEKSTSLMNTYLAPRTGDEIEAYLKDDRGEDLYNFTCRWMPERHDLFHQRMRDLQAFADEKVSQ